MTQRDVQLDLFVQQETLFAGDDLAALWNLADQASPEDREALRQLRTPPTR